MDAKMSEAEREMREQVVDGLKIPREHWGIESAPEVVLSIDGAQSVLSELDRLREFVENVRVALPCENSNDTECALSHLLEKLDRARATGGAGTT